MRKQFFDQGIPIIVTFFTFCILVFGIYGSILLLDFLPTKNKIIPIVRFPDILIGLTIYLKTSIDFALFLGNLMSKYTGVKNRIAIELGTSLGNAIGTLFILCVWTIFKEIPLLLIAMILLAAFVLLHMAEESLREFLEDSSPPPVIKQLLFRLITFLHYVTLFTAPVARHILPSSTLSNKTVKTFFGVISFAFTIPFILGLDDFAGYIPLFSLVNVLGFAVGTFLGHMLLTTALFSSPKITVKIVRHPIVMVLGSFAFIAIAGIGFFEAGRVLQHYLLPR